MVSKWIKKISRAIRKNPLDALCYKAKKEKKSSFLIAWNRGLGDIPLLLYGMVDRIREILPNASITFITRKKLELGFYLLDGVKVIAVKDWERKKPYDVRASLINMGKNPDEFDVIIENPDPTYWMGWQVGKLIPKLTWQEPWEDLWKSFPELLDTKGPQKRFIGVQTATETGYNSFRDWPKAYWEELFSFLETKNQKVVLFGVEKKPLFSHSNLLDLRQETSPLEFISIVKNCCHTLIVPDSALLALTYYLDEKFPLDIFSLWADPTLGVLRQNVPSPNPSLFHLPLIAKERDLHHLPPQQLIEQLQLRQKWTLS